MFIKAYAFFEILWLIFYIISVSWSYGLNVPDDVKADVGRLDTHILTPITVLTVYYSKRPFGWIFALFVFILFRESINMAEISYFSNLQVYYSLWGYTLFVACYQSLLSLIAFFWYVGVYIKNRKNQKFGF